VFEIFYFLIFSLKKINLYKDAKNPEKLFENWKLGFPIGAQPHADHSKFFFTVSRCSIFKSDVMNVRCFFRKSKLLSEWSLHMFSCLPAKNTLPENMASIVQHFYLKKTFLMICRIIRHKWRKTGWRCSNFDEFLTIWPLIHLTIVIFLRCYKNCWQLFNIWENGGPFFW